MYETCDKNISNEEYENLRNCLCKTKNWIKFFLKKGPSLQQKGTLVWQKCSRIIQKSSWKSNSPTRSCFWQVSFFFFKKGTF